MKTKPGKGIRRALFRSRTTGLKGILAVMIIFGIIASGLYFLKTVYTEYAGARADIILTFPEIASSRNPDGSRFTYYDFVSDESVAEALAAMKAKGKYVNFEVADLKDCFFVYSNLDGSAGSAVSAARSEGNDFSYVANEYKLTYIQPHDYKTKNIAEMLFGADLSEEFLKELVKANMIRISERMGGIEGFRILSETVPSENYDYSEELLVYRTKIKAIISYLKGLHKRDADFISKDSKLTIADLQSKYEFLVADRLDGISDFVESSGISRNPWIASNKLKVNIENNTLKYNKFLDRSLINGFAMENYDQTFTENLINVVQNKEYGLYQARPKTAFDSVTVEKHNSDESISEYGGIIREFNNDLAVFSTLSSDPSERNRLMTKAEELIKGFRKEYGELTRLSDAVIKEYYDSLNEGYFTVKIKPRRVISKGLIVKCGIVFVIGAALAYVMVIFFSSVSDARKIGRKKKQMKKIKEKGDA